MKQAIDCASPFLSQYVSRSFDYDALTSPDKGMFYLKSRHSNLPVILFRPSFSSFPNGKNSQPFMSRIMNIGFSFWSPSVSGAV